MFVSLYVMTIKLFIEVDEGQSNSRQTATVRYLGHAPGQPQIVEYSSRVLVLEYRSRSD